MFFNLFRKAKSPEVKRLPDPVRRHLIRRFRLSEESVGMLRCVQSEGTSGGRSITRFRIFSPARAQDQGLQIVSASQLDQYPGLLLFEGHMDEHGAVRMAACRSPKKPSETVYRPQQQDTEDPYPLI